MICFTCIVFFSISGDRYTLHITSLTGSMDQDEYTFYPNGYYSITCKMGDDSERQVTFERIGEESLGNMVYQNGNQLIFENIQPEHRGIYQCTTELNGQTIKASAIIDVHGRVISNLYIHQSHE